MRIGYACQTVGVPHTRLRSCTLKTVSEETLCPIISDNLDALEHILDYNIKNEIYLFRISSDLIPFGSNPANTLKWWDIYKERLEAIGNKITSHGIRVSMHPGQYTVLNSPRCDVVERAHSDLVYHCRVLDSMKLSKEHKMVLHIGGAYNQKEQAMQRFIENYADLEQNIKSRLVLENDDKLFHIKDVLNIAETVQAPVIFDNLHHKINKSAGKENEFFWIAECQKTWKKEDGFQKIHYSQQNPMKKQGSHSDTICAEVFRDFYEQLNRKDIDIMMEVKDKNLSAIKGMNATRNKPAMKYLEQEWAKYKYCILEKSHNDYNEIRRLLREKGNYPSALFYEIIDRALKQETTIGNGVNAAQHVWGYFNEIASDKEKKAFEKKLQLYTEGKQSLMAVKRNLWKLTQAYEQDYLFESYYFIGCY